MYSIKIKDNLASSPTSAVVPEVKPALTFDRELIEIAAFFNEYLEKKIPPILNAFSQERDGGLNPALKIFDFMKNKKNKIDNERWEIFVLLKNEEGEVNFRSGFKSHTSEFNIKGIEQFNLSLFPKQLVWDLSQRLLAYRYGHPSLALDFKALDRGHLQALPVFGAGWLIRNDKSSQKRIQIYWSSGRYERTLSDDACHLLQLCVAFYLMSEYGKDFMVEFFSWEPNLMEKFMTQKANNGRAYEWNYMANEVLRLITEENIFDQGASIFRSSL